MEEACKMGVCLVLADGILFGPVDVVFGKPGEIMLVEVHACTDEVQ